MIPEPLVASAHLTPEARARLGHAEAWAQAVRELYLAYCRVLDGPNAARGTFWLELRLGSAPKNLTRKRPAG